MLSKHIQFNILFILFVLLLFPLTGKSYGTEEQAARFLKKGQYLQALPIYKEYSELYPDAPIYTYYYGVCLTETGHYGNKTRKLLLKVALEDVPVNVLFYIGKNYHAMNDLETALIYYQQFKDVSKSKEQHDVNFRKIIKLCENYQNPFTNEPPESYLSQYIENKTADSITVETKFEESPEIVTQVEEKKEEIVAPEDKQPLVADSLVNVQNKYEGSEILKTGNTVLPEEIIEEIPDGIQDTVINFVLTTEIYYSRINQFRNDTAKNHFVKALVNSNKMERIVIQTEQLRKDYDRTESPAFKKDIANEVITLEKKQLALKSAIDYDFLKARELEMEFWNNASGEEFNMLKEENKSELLPAIPEENLPEDTISQEMPYEEKVATEPTDSIIEPEEIFNEEIEEIKPVVTYKIQIGAYKSELPESTKNLYKKISVLRRIDQFTDERGITIYTIGELSNFEDAQKLQDQIRQESIKDAFIVAFKQGKRISLKEALENTEE